MKFKKLTKVQKEKERMNRLSKWHRKFIWWPTRLSNDETIIIWLQFALRRGVQWYYSDSRGRYRPEKWQFLESEFDLVRDPDWQD
jgi:hypothetical protein